jgi:hypothetical protein
MRIGMSSAAKFRAAMAPYRHAGIPLNRSGCYFEKLKYRIWVIFEIAEISIAMTMRLSTVRRIVLPTSG